MSLHQTVIGIGSNIEPQKNIDLALTALKNQFSVISVSSFLQTSPVGFVDQADFLNGAVLLETALEKDACRHCLKAIEISLDRKKSTNKYGPRTIDLDIVVWDAQICDDEFYERTFLRRSVFEVMPALVIDEARIFTKDVGEKGD